MPQRSLTVLTADPKVRAACEAAVATVPQAVSSVTFFDGCEALEAAGPDGLVVIDPRCVPSHAVHEWSLGFLRQHRALVFLLTLGDADDGEGLARFVGAQGALAIPVDPAALAERLASPLGASFLKSTRAPSKRISVRNSLRSSAAMKTVAKSSCNRSPTQKRGSTCSITGSIA
jgi:hypothetical protein